MPFQSLFLTLAAQINAKNLKCRNVLPKKCILMAFFNAFWRKTVGNACHIKKK